MLWCMGIALLVEFFNYLESFSIIWSCIRYIWHTQFGLLFIEPQCNVERNVKKSDWKCIIKVKLRFGVFVFANRFREMVLCELIIIIGIKHMESLIE